MSESEAVSRRGFLRTLTGAALGTVAANIPAESSSGAARHAGQLANQIDLHSLIDPPLDPQWGHWEPSAASVTPATSLFRANFSAAATPLLDPATYTLLITGWDSAPLRLSLADLYALPAREITMTLACISNPAGGGLHANVRLRGVDLVAWFASRGVPRTRSARFTAADGYGTAVDLAWLTESGAESGVESGAILAYALNGEPLTAEQGAPLRVAIPRLYGMKQPRWITRIDFIDGAYFGYWEGRGYSNIAAIKTCAHIIAPTNNATVQAGHLVQIHGVAYTGQSAISQVEIQIDGGDWFAVTLHPAAGWSAWSHAWRVPAPGAYQIGVRATDTTGFTQSREAFSTAVVDEAKHGKDDGKDGIDTIHRITLIAR